MPTRLNHMYSDNGEPKILIDEKGMRVNVTNGGNVKDTWNGSANITKSFSTKMKVFSIVNDGTSNLTFTINSMTFTVKGGEEFEDYFDAFTSVTITTAVPYRALVRGE